MKKFTKTAISWTLILCMVFSILSTAVFAADTYDGITVTGGVAGTDYSWDEESKTLTILEGTQLTLSGTGVDIQVLVAGTTEAHLTLNELSINNTADDCVAPIKLSDTATLELTLSEGSTNTLDTHYIDSDIFCAHAEAIHVPQGTAITINGTGTLNAYSGRYNAAIGNKNGACGNITINSGIVNAFSYGTENYPGGIGIGSIITSDNVDCSSFITINGGTVTAYGDMTGIGFYDAHYNPSASANFISNIIITGGTVNAYGIPYSEGVNPDNASGTYLRSVGIGGNAYGVPGASNIEISGGVVKAYGSDVGIGGDFDKDNNSESTEYLNIKITGGTITAKGFSSYDGIGIGGDMRSSDNRTIEISGDAVVDSLGYNYKSPIGGGDNSGSTITIKGNAVVKSASTIGSSGCDNDYTGYAGGTIQILDNASVGGNEYNETVEHIGGSHWNIYSDNANDYIGGAGGDITINTTGTVKASSIGGGSRGNGGDGGNITIQSGTVLTSHIGGGDGRANNGSGIGGNGGTINISGGQVGQYYGYYGIDDTPTASTNKKVGYGVNSFYYSAAGIGGGGGTNIGGNGGNISISGGTVYANAGVTVYDPSTGDTASSGTGVGGAGIGGGNGASSGVINISGGLVEVSYVEVYPYGATTATTAPALIGGGSAGSAGNITISGGFVKVAVDSHNNPIYGDDATVIGQGKGATDAGGWIKVTGGNLSIPISTYQTTVARPVPWPTAADGSTMTYPANIYFYNIEGMPQGVSFNDGSEIVSMTLTDKSSNLTYSYGIKDMNPTSSLWLPIAEDINTWTGYEHHNLFDVTLSIKKDNTIYGFEGVLYFRENENYVGGVESGSQLTFTGEVIETLQLTSDWGNQTKAYNGTDQKPAFTVKNINGDTLVKDQDYTIKIEHIPHGQSTRIETTEMINSGAYYVTATGKDGTAYEDMTAELDEFWINAKSITAIYSGDFFTKEYDGTTDVYRDGNLVESLTLSVNNDDLCGDDSLSDIVASNPRYVSMGVGTEIEINTNSLSYTYTQGGQTSSIHNYTINLPANLKGDITVKVIGETNLDSSAAIVTKVYDGTTNCSLANVSGSVALVDLVGTEVATVNIIGVSSFDSKDASSNRTVTLTIGGLAGANSENYTLAGGATTVDVISSITVADYTYNLTEAQQAQEFTQGGGLSEISLPAAANGVNGETVSGEVTIWHDEACTTQQATNTTVNALTIGSHYLYVKFVPNASETNYDTTKVTTGKVVVLTVVEGDPQELSFETSSVMNKTYGEAAFTNIATNNSVGSGAITYSSSNTDVAVVDATTGEVTIKCAGTASITATAAEVEGQYRETSIDYTLTVSKKPITVTANDTSRKFGEPNPTFSILNPSEMLVSGDDENDLDITLSTTATIASSVGAYDITGTSGSANYDVTITSGTLTVNKASAPTVSGVNKSLLFSEAHSNVTVSITGLPADCGTSIFIAGLATGDTEIINGSVANLSAGITFSTNIGDENKTAIIPVTVMMQNYEDVIINVTVTLVGKTPVTITGVSVTNKTYNGSVISHSGTPANNQGYTGTYEYIWSSGSAPKNAGNHTLTVKIPDDNYEFMGEVEIQFTIAQKALTVKPQNISIYNGAPLPTEFTLIYEGLVSGDTITPTGTPEFAMKNGADALANSKTNGTYTVEWINKDTVTIEHANYVITKADGTLTITSIPSSGGGGGSFTPALPPEDNGSSVTTTNGVSTAAVEAQVSSSDGTTTVSVDSAAVKAAVDAAKAVAEKGKTAAAVEIKVNTPANADKVEFSIPKDALTVFSDSKVEKLSLVSGIGKLDIDAQTTASIAAQAGGSTINISVAQVDTKQELNSKQQAAVANDPVYDISISSGDKYISSFDGGSITISLPYELKAGEDPSGVVVWYLDAQGNLQKVESSYDAKTGTVTFTTSHLSLYAVGYDESVLWGNPFTDVSENAWYYEAVRFVNLHKIMEGTSSKEFSPNLATTRGMLVTILYRMEGYPTAGSAEFTDIFGNEWYADAVAWAANNNIVKGYGDCFGPKDTLTREQMAVILMNYSKFKGYEASISSIDLSAFSDSVAVSSWSFEAMTWVVSNGLIEGNAGKLEPAGSATRSQAATILMRFCQLMEK